MKKEGMIGIVAVFLFFILAQTVLAETGIVTAGALIVISFISFLAKFGLAVWVLLKNSSAKVNKYFCIVFLGQAIWDVGKHAMWQVTDPAVAIVWSKISYTGYIISVFFFIQFIWAYLKRKNFLSSTFPGKLLVYGSMVAMVVALWMTDLVVVSLYERASFIGTGYPFWVYNYGLLYNYFFLWFQMVPFLYGLFVFVKKYLYTKLEDKKKQLLWVLIGSSIPIVIGIPLNVVMPALGIFTPPNNVVLTLIMSIFITVGIAKYKFLSIEPISEKGKGTKLSADVLRKYRMDYSNYYLIKHQKSVEISYQMLLRYLGKNHFGLIVTAKPPEKVRDEHGIKTTPIVWMTESETDHPSVDPVDIEQLYETIKKFCSKVKNAFVLLDGIDYLLVHNNFNKIVHFLQEIKMLIDDNGGVLILPEGNLKLDLNQERVVHNELTLLPYSDRKLKIEDSSTKKLCAKFRQYRHVILGFTPVTESLLAELEKENIKPTIITTEKIHHHIPLEKIKVIIGDPLSKKILVKAGIDKPKTLVMVTMKNDSNAMLAINKVRELTDKAMLVTNINNHEFTEIAFKAGANYVVPSSSIGGRLISLTLCAPNAVRWIMDSTTLSNKDIELVDIEVRKKDFFVNKTIKKADDDLGHAANIIAVSNEEGLQKIPDDAYKIKEGDRIVLIANIQLVKKKTPDEIRKSLSTGKCKKH
ncbi:DUF835 domain-containing protein [Nanoarchaeota archaeon]